MISIEFTLAEIEHLLHGLRYLVRYYGEDSYKKFDIQELRDFYKRVANESRELVCKLKLAKIKLYEESQKHE